jgi:hypothetical protein
MPSIPVGATGSFSLVVMPDPLASRFGLHQKTGD